MEDYFNSVNKLKSLDFNELTIVLGNESCDLDSVISSLVYAIFLHWQHQQIKCKVCTKNKRDEEAYKDDIFVSILNVDREDYDLKTEVVYVLSEHGINNRHLVFKNDIDLQQLVVKKPTKVVLVDHHTLSAHDRFLAPYVTEIIDHRPTDRSDWNFKDDTRSTIEVVGSCATLVARRIKELSSLMGRDVDFFNTYPFISDMLHGTIILDTVNFSKEFDKTTPQDVEMVLFLEDLLKSQDCQLYRKTKLDHLTRAKAEVSSLTAAQLLRKDAKTFGHILVPSFPILVQEFLKKSNVKEALEESLHKRNCSIVLLLGMDLSAGMKRDVAIYANETEIAEQLGSFLERWRDSYLQLECKEAPSPVSRYYRQLNLAATRKQYIPALNQYLSSGNQ
ncbi:unnamed protein product [Chilo suppressalis]|uniref:DHHA2 domain-containing protein n=1 Tax=Chilo suppressalis TaxID=168631 RepID=A0ABN8L5R2_CHISP|nr:unnamed protein product [Chilo suppressalis]